MTQAAPVFKNANILNTRRTLEGIFHLTPGPVVNHILEFALAYNANKYDIGIYAYCALSNHQHLPFYDPNGHNADFRRDFHSQVTRSLNRYRGTSEAKWSPDQKSPVVLYDVEALLDKIAYTIANPCRHHLVDKPEQWPGVISLVKDLGGEPKVIKKPECFYDPNGDVPDEVSLKFVKPPELSHLTIEEYRQEIARRGEAKCKAARRSRKGRVVGAAAVLSQDPTDKAKSKKPVGKLNPRFACSQQALRIALCLWLTDFRALHRKARLAFEAGDASSEFPFGTYLHARRYQVKCSSTGPPEWPHG